MIPTGASFRFEELECSTFNSGAVSPPGLEDIAHLSSNRTNVTFFYWNSIHVISWIQLNWWQQCNENGLNSIPRPCNVDQECCSWWSMHSCHFLSKSHAVSNNRFYVQLQHGNYHISVPLFPRRAVRHVSSVWCPHSSHNCPPLSSWNGGFGPNQFLM